MLSQTKSQDKQTPSQDRDSTTNYDFKTAQLPKLPHDNEGRIKLEPISVMQSALSINKGVFLGDQHGECSIPAYLTANMDSLKKAGVGTFFIEMFDAKDQAVLDAFATSGDKSLLKQHLTQSNWGDKGPGWTDEIANVIEAANKCGIKVVGIDVPHSGDSRLETSNPAWAETVNRVMEGKEGKYIIFGGAAHSANYSANKGVDQLLGIPALDFVDSQDKYLNQEDFGKSPGAYLSDQKKSDIKLILPKQ
jgi:uncharacterized iron-regulated protein